MAADLPPLSSPRESKSNEPSAPRLVRIQHEDSAAQQDDSAMVRTHNLTFGRPTPGSPQRLFRLRQSQGSSVDADREHERELLRDIGVGPEGVGVAPKGVIPT